MLTKTIINECANVTDCNLITYATYCFTPINELADSNEFTKFIEKYAYDWEVIGEEDLIKLLQDYLKTEEKNIDVLLDFYKESPAAKDIMIAECTYMDVIDPDYVPWESGFAQKEFEEFLSSMFERNANCREANR